MLLLPNPGGNGQDSLRRRLPVAEDDDPRTNELRARMNDKRRVTTTMIVQWEWPLWTAELARGDWKKAGRSSGENDDDWNKIAHKTTEKEREKGDVDDDDDGKNKGNP